MISGGSKWASALIIRLFTPIRATIHKAVCALSWHESAPDVADKVVVGISVVDCTRASVVQVDGAGRGGVVDPGFACWIGINGAPGDAGRKVLGMIGR